MIPKSDRAEPEIPTSSMADIAFLLIIYFMVTSTLMATRGLDFTLPKEEKDPPPVERDESVLVHIQSSGTLFVDKKPMALAGLMPYLASVLSQRADKPVIIQTDPKAPYGAMVRVYDILRQGALLDGNLKWLGQPGVTQEDLELGQPISIAIPTRRDIEMFW